MDWPYWLRVGGFFVCLLGFCLIALSSIPVTREEEVIRAKLEIDPGGYLDPYDAGTYYHTKIIGTSRLLLRCLVHRGGPVQMIVSGSNLPANLPGPSRHEGSAHLSPGDAFTSAIDRAYDQYTFGFENLAEEPALLDFSLEAIWTDSLSPAIGLMGILGFVIAAPLGLTMFLIGLERTVCTPLLLVPASAFILSPMFTSRFLFSPHYHFWIIGSVSAAGAFLVWMVGLKRKGTGVGKSWMDRA